MRGLFMQYLPEHQLPSAHYLSGVVLPRVAGRIAKERLAALGVGRQILTATWDGWTDCGQEHVEAVVMIPPSGRGEYVGNLALHSLRHTSDNIKEAMSQFLERTGIPWGSVAALASDSPSVNVKLRRLICNDHPHILNIRCSLHEFNGMVKAICKLPEAEALMRKARAVVASVRRSAGGSGLKTFVETRWFSIIPFLGSLDSHKQQLEALAGQRGGMSEDARGPARDWAFWAGVKGLLALVRPLCDAIARLERRGSTLGDVVVEMLTAALAVQGLSDDLLEPFPGIKQAATAIISDRGARFLELDTPALKCSPHVLAFFLTPPWRSVAIPANHLTDAANPLGKISSALYRLLSEWGKKGLVQVHRRDGLKQLFQAEIVLYHRRAPPYNFDGDADDPRAFFSLIRKQGDVTAARAAFLDVACALLGVACHSAEVERLFSAMGFTKTTRRNRMRTATLEQCSHVILHQRAVESAELEERQRRQEVTARACRAANAKAASGAPAAANDGPASAGDEPAAGGDVPAAAGDGPLAAGDVPAAWDAVAAHDPGSGLGVLDSEASGEVVVAELDDGDDEQDLVLDGLAAYPDGLLTAFDLDAFRKERDRELVPLPLAADAEADDSDIEAVERDGWSDAS